MELRSGYKKTEIGLIPEDWDAIPVGDLFEFKNGLNKAKRFFGHGTPIVNYMDVFGQPGLRAAQIAGRVEVTKAEREAYEVRKGDVFFTRTSETVDEIGVAAAMLDPMKDAVYSGFVLRARPKDSSLDDPFKAYCFSPRYFRQQVIARATYTTRALTNGRSLSAALLARPPLPEQRVIAEALSDVDASILALLRLIAKKRDLRQGAMQRLLTGQTRLPGFTAPWQEKRLGELGTWRGGMTPSMQIAHYWEGGSFPWLSSGDVKSPTLHDSGMHITEAAIASKATTVVPAGSIVFVMRSGILRKYFPVASIERSMAINQDIKALTVAADYDPTFIRQMLHWRGDDVLQSCLKTGTTVESIDFGWLKAFALRLPSTREEQSAIAQALSDVDGEITALDARLDKTRSLKQAMMQALLTGRVRLLVRGNAAPQTKEAAHV